jgi:hypothetical protein
MRGIIVAVVMALALVALPFVASAQSGGDALIRAKIEAIYGEDITDLDEVIDQLREAGLGWGEIIMVLHLASLSDQDVEDIMAMRDGGMGWGAIARALGVDPSELGRSVAAVMSEGKAGGRGKPEGTPSGNSENAPGRGDAPHGKP